jgi:hypothetical protein
MMGNSGTGNEIKLLEIRLDWFKVAFRRPGLTTRKYAYEDVPAEDFIS